MPVLVICRFAYKPPLLSVPRGHFCFSSSCLLYVLFAAMSLIDILIVRLRLARWPPTWEMAVYMDAAGDVFGGSLFFVFFFPHCVLGGMWLELCQFLRIFLLTIDHVLVKDNIQLRNNIFLHCKKAKEFLGSMHKNTIQKQLWPILKSFLQMYM